MTARNRRLLAGALTALLATVLGYTLGIDDASLAPREVSAPSADQVRVIYSLDQKKTNEEIIALIDAAQTHAYFAVYTFTMTDIAEALARAKARGVDVRGIVDRGQAEEKFSKPVMTTLSRAGIPVVTEQHEGGSGIMHIKMLVTDSAYAHGSYNWTKSATTVNDEILEIGTNEELRQVYEDLWKRLYERYEGSVLGSSAQREHAGTIDYTDAPRYIGQDANVRGTVVDVYTSQSGTTFLNYCSDYKTCPFSVAVFSSDAKKFGDLAGFKGKTLTISGEIVSYQGRTEIILSSPTQVSR